MPGPVQVDPAVREAKWRELPVHASLELQQYQATERISNAWYAVGESWLMMEGSNRVSFFDRDPCPTLRCLALFLGCASALVVGPSRHRRTCAGLLF